MKLFSSLVKSINEFLPDDPMVTESQLEEKLKTHLESNGFIVFRQVTKRKDRYDLICRERNEVVCMELKIYADISDIEQFDRYLKKFKGGFIVVCWRASFSMQDIFKQVTDQSPIPVQLIELSKKYSLT